MFLRVLDWEGRLGSNLLERAEWVLLVEDLLALVGWVL